MVSVGSTWLYRGNVLRESLDDLIQATGYAKHPFMDAIGDGQAGNDRFEWNERARRARALVAAQQGYDYTAAEVTSATRRLNLTQILKFEPFVSYTAAASNMAGIENLVTDAIKYETGSLLDAINYALINSTVVTGASNLAQRMAGIINVLFNSPGLAGTTTNCGVSANATNITSMQDTLDSRGFMATDIFTDSTLKIRFSQLTTSNTKWVMADDKKVIESLSVYEGDFAVTQLQTERDILSATSYGLAAGNRLFFGIDRRQFKKAWLRRPGMKPVPEREDGVLTEVNAELTLQYQSAIAGQVDFNVK